MKNNHIFLTLVLLFTSCSSLFYSNEERTENSTYTISCDQPVSMELKDNEDYNMSLVSPTTKDYSTNRYVSTNTLPNFNKKSRTIILTKENFVPIEITIKKTPRVKAVILNYFALFCLLPIDVFRSDFYKVARKSRYIKVNMKFNEYYLDLRLKKILSKNNLDSLNNFVKLYPYYYNIDLVINLADSLNYKKAVETYSESAIDVFISNHPKSEFLNQAKELKKSYEEASSAFDEIKNSNSIPQFSEFLNNYPNSLQRPKAVNTLVNLAYKKAIQKNTINEFLIFNKNYLLKYESDLKKTDTFIKKSNSIGNLIDGLILNEFNKNSNDKYQQYSSFWKAFSKILSENKNFYNLKKCFKVKSEISDLLLSQLSKINNEINQKKFISKCSIDFPKFQISDYGYFDSNINYINAIISSVNKFSGSLKLYNLQYFNNWLDHSSEQEPFRGLVGFNYLGKSYSNYSKANIEKITLTNGKISELILYENQYPLASVNFEYPQNYEFNYYLKNGEKVKTEFYINKENYYYEFVGGENITLSKIKDKIRQAEISESINYQMSNQIRLEKFKGILNIYKDARNNKLPNKHSLNIQIDQSIQKTNESINYIQNRIYEEENIRREQERLERQKAQEERNRSAINGTPIQGIYQVYLRNEPQAFHYLLNKQGVLIFCGCDENQYESIFANLNSSIKYGYVKTGTYNIINGKLNFYYSDGKSAEFIYDPTFNRIYSSSGTLSMRCVRSEF